MGAFVVMFKSSELENDICYTSFPTAGNLLTEERVYMCFKPECLHLDKPVLYKRGKQLPRVPISECYAPVCNPPKKPRNSSLLVYKQLEERKVAQAQIKQITPGHESETSLKKREVQAKTRGNNKPGDF